MRFAVSLTKEAVKDLQRLVGLRHRAGIEAWRVGPPCQSHGCDLPLVGLLESNPFSSHIALDSRLERELVIPFRAAGYVALFLIVSDHEVVVSAVRHQREDDYR